jgi:hypothetical protein
MPSTRRVALGMFHVSGPDAGYRHGRKAGISSVESSAVPTKSLTS